MMSIIKNIDRKTLQLTAISLALFATIVYLRGDLFLRPINIQFMLFQLVEPGMFALCIAIVYLSRGIDLSIVAIANLVGIVNGIFLRKFVLEDGSNVGLALALCVVFAVAIGVMCGLVNGFFIAKLGIFPILVTLGTQNVFMGISMILTEGRAESNFPQPLLNFGRAMVFGFPMLTIFFLVIFVALCVIVHKTPYGLKLQLMGSNKKAAWFTGIDNVKVTFITYTISGVIAALAGIAIMARNNAAMPNYGLGFVFQALLICVLAGISPLGGRGKVYNVLLSLVALQILSTGFNMLRVSPLIRDSIFGFMLIFALLLDFAWEKWRNNRLNKQAVAASAPDAPKTPV